MSLKYVQYSAVTLILFLLNIRKIIKKKIIKNQMLLLATKPLDLHIELETKHIELETKHIELPFELQIDCAWFSTQYAWFPTVSSSSLVCAFTLNVLGFQLNL